MSSPISSEDFYNAHTRDMNELEKDAKEYPFSSLTQYLLSSHYKKTGHEGYEKSVHRTASYFTNPRWLQFQLSQLGPEQIITLPEDSDLPLEQHHQAEKEINGHFAVATEEELEYLAAPTPKEEVVPDVQMLGEHLEDLEQRVDQNDPEIIQETPSPESHTLGEHRDHFEEGLIENNYQNLEAQNNEELLPETETLGEHAEVNAEIAEHSGDQLIEVQQEGDLLPAVAETQNLETDENQETGLSKVAGDEEQNGDQKKEDPSLKRTESEMSNSESNNELSEPLAFEPMHTVDYFASQGIRVPEEPFTNDKLGTQMKSFTEWLKSMKKVPAEKLQEQNTLAEDIIKSAAEVSNIDTEVLTEAMAEVLIKQDKREKAIEMYNKLSLINPSKSAYFAAKIESIKST